MDTKQMENEKQDAFNSMHLLNRKQRTSLANDLLANRYKFMESYTPLWRRLSPCVVNVLLVTDGALDFGIGGFGLSEFITSFKKLEDQSGSNVRYKVTLAHRDNPGGFDPMLNSNPTITNRIINFNFVSSVNLGTFDQLWIFGFNSGPSLQSAEVTAIDNFMNNGGGVFATGDHGVLGSAMGSQIPRVKDMRMWSDTSGNNAVNEVSMTGERRNDTNRPAAGATVSSLFNNQSDNIPQQIAVRSFASGLPHPLLSISKSKRASGIIDIMPDHPHEGECRPETTFTVHNPVTNAPQNVRTQIIATSFVLGGSFAAQKDPTIPHCFPSISVFDGRVANVGRIVIDSTWHHFVNINLNGVSTSRGGLDNADFEVIQQYFMNIATWISRRKFMLCFYRKLYIQLFKETQLIEASLNNPKWKLSEIKLADLNSIGALAKEIIADNYTPAMAEEFMIASVEPFLPELADYMNSWAPKDDKRDVKNDYYQEWVNFDLILGTAVGAGFIALRDNEKLFSNLTEKSFEQIDKTFYEGTKTGAEMAMQSLERNIATSKSLFKSRK